VEKPSLWGETGRGGAGRHAATSRAGTQTSRGAAAKRAATGPEAAERRAPSPPTKAAGGANGLSSSTQRQPKKKENRQAEKNKTARRPANVFRGTTDWGACGTLSHGYLPARVHSAAPPARRRLTPHGCRALAAGGSADGAAATPRRRPSTAAAARPAPIHTRAPLTHHRRPQAAQASHGAAHLPHLPPRGAGGSPPPAPPTKRTAGGARRPPRRRNTGPRATRRSRSRAPRRRCGERRGHRRPCATSGRAHPPLPSRTRAGGSGRRPHGPAPRPAPLRTALVQSRRGARPGWGGGAVARTGACRRGPNAAARRAPRGSRRSGQARLAMPPQRVGARAAPGQLRLRRGAKTVSSGKRINRTATTCTRHCCGPQPTRKRWGIQQNCVLRPCAHDAPNISRDQLG